MAVPLIATKLNLPVLRSRVVERPRLRALLDRGKDARLTLISAPAGFGKTTLLADWLTRLPDPQTSIAWLSLDAGDNEPTLFWPHLVAALQALGARRGTSFPELPSAMQPDRGFITSLLNELAATPAPTILILDDLHLVDRADIHEQLGFLIEHLPAHMHIIVSTRADPAVPLARLRARGELIEIRSANLRFTGEEATAYLNDVMYLGLSAADAATLEMKTEGWIAALQLAVLSLDGRADAAEFIEDFAGSSRYIVDYLVEEVLARVPENVRYFLLETCFLDRLSGPLCDAVTGGSGSRQMLETLDRANLFLVPLDNRREWYRYHHLFADVLETQLDAAARDRLRVLRRLASDWYEAHGERSEAIRHALAAEDFERAAELIELAVFDMQKMRQELTIRAWMRALPDSIVRTRPVLGIALAGVLASVGEFEGLEDRLRDVERGLAIAAADDSDLEGVVVADHDQLPRVPALVELYRAALGQTRGDLPDSIRHAERVLDIATADDHLTCAAAASLLGIAYWSEGKLKEAHAGWTAGRDGLMRAGHVADMLGVSIALADISLALGRLREAAHILERALQVSAAEPGSALRGTADVHTGLAMVLRERNELEGAICIPLLRATGSRQCRKFASSLSGRRCKRRF
jgi:LuxR family transcriptional regulator, maltose regulon positive regulatory protein